jgi:uncharacterized protein
MPLLAFQGFASMMRSSVLICCAILTFTFSTTFGQNGNNLPSATVTVYPIAFAQAGPDARPTGHCRSMPITVGGLPTGQVRVGVFESQLDGTGHLWRATAWQAALTASQLLDFDPRTMQIAVSVEGSVDGPSAGALFTVGILSAVRGDELNEEVTMTGTINPDGTIGPVGGIVYKLEGAANAGKKTVLIPSSSRLEYDAHTEKFVDLIERGKELGLTVNQVNDVWEAYRQFTGKELPRHKFVRVPEISSKFSEDLRSRTIEWIGLRDKAEKAYEAWGDDAHSEYSDSLMEESNELVKRSLALTMEGRAAPAYWDAVMACANAWQAHEVGRCILAMGSNDDNIDAARNVVNDQAWLNRDMDKTVAAMRYFRPTSLDQVAIYMSACDAFFEGLCYKNLADKMVAMNLDDKDLTSDFVITASEQLVVCWLDMILARDYLEMSENFQGLPLAGDAEVLELAKFYEHCAVAGLTVVDELEVKKVGEKYGLTQDGARVELMLRDPHYAATRLAAHDVLPRLQTYFGDGPQYAYARLAATSSLHCSTAMLIAKYYSLGVETDEFYNVIGVRNETVLADWLDDSRDQAARSIGALIPAKIDPTTCVQMYSIARIFEGRGDLSRLDALDSYFGTTVTSQILRRLAGVKGIEK